MKSLLLLLIMVVIIVDADLALDQSLTFKEKHPDPIGIITTTAGAPIGYNETITFNKKLITNQFFMDTITHAVRERTAERVVHPKAAGAFGYLKVTEDVSDIFKSKLFCKVGEKTPVAMRFSSAIQDRGGVDTIRDARGFAIKFYTEEGNFDIAGFSTPMYAYKDPIFFPTFVRAQVRNPSTYLRDGNTLWDFLTLRPENLYMFMLVFGDRGVPKSYRYMPGYSIHTYQVVNKKGDTHFVRFIFLPNAGIKHLSSEEATKIAGEDPDYYIRDMYNAIASGKFPKWKLYIQVLTPLDVKNAGFDVFDVTKVLPEDKYPLRLVGYVIANRNPVNYFAEVEHLAFCPANLVPGILGAPGKIFEARCMVYRDAQNYRLGGNFYNIPVNCPFRTKRYIYNRDGIPPVNDNQRDYPNYYPNSFNGAVPSKSADIGGLEEIHEEQPNNFDQARELYINGMSSGERSRLVNNILNSLSPVVKFIQDRAVKLYTMIHPDLGNRIRQGLQGNRTST